MNGLFKRFEQLFYCIVLSIPAPKVSQGKPITKIPHFGGIPLLTGLRPEVRQLRLKTWFVLVAFALSLFAGIPFTTYSTILENTPPSPVIPGLAGVDHQASPPSLNSLPIDEFSSYENQYWQERQKVDFLTHLFGPQEGETDEPAGQESDLTPETKVDGVAAVQWEERTILNIDVDKLFYSPGDVVSFVVQSTQNLAPKGNYNFKLVVYNNPSDLFMNYDGYWNIRQGQTPFKTITGQTDSNGFYEGSFEVPNAGQYSILVEPTDDYHNYYGKAYRSILVSDLGLFFRIPYYYLPDQPLTGYGYVFDGTSFTPVANATVTVGFYRYDWNDGSLTKVRSQTVHSDADGRADFSLTVGSSDYWGYLVIEASAGDQTSQISRSVWSSYYYHKSQSYEFVPTLDKPIYQPGETVHARALVWENDFLTATKEAATFEPVNLEFRDQSYNLLSQVTRVTDANGVVTIDLPLDESFEVGSYFLTFQKNNSQQAVEVVVDYYEKPAFRVNLNLDSGYVPPGKAVTGEVVAEFYFGKPVTNGEVMVALKTPYGETLVEVEGVTSSKGSFSFELSVPSKLEDSQLDVVATVEDPVGRVVEASDTVVLVEGLYVGAWYYPYLPSVDDEVTISYWAYQTNTQDSYYWYYYWEPLVGGEATITVKGRSSGFLGMDSWTVVQVLGGTTNGYGYGEVSFTLDRGTVLGYKEFEVEVKVDAGDGRDETTTFTLRYAKLSLDLSVDQEKYNPGDTVSLTAAVKDLAGNDASGSLVVYMYDSDYNTLYRGIRENITKESFNLPLSPLSPSGRYTVWAHLRYLATTEQGYSYYTYIYGDALYFSVSEESSLSLESTEESYVVGDTISIEGMVSKDSLATPIYVELAKRGVVATLSLTPESDNFGLELNATDLLAPRVFVFAFGITNAGAVVEEWLVLQVNQSLSLDISSDKDIYEPGESASVTIKILNSRGESVSGIAAITFVDSSVYGVKEDPEWELDYFEELSYWPNIATETNWRGRQPLWYYSWYYLLDYNRGYTYYGGYGPENYWAMTDDEASGDTAVPTRQSMDVSQIDVRDNLPESMNWQPTALIPASGYTFDLALPDNIGEWTVRVTATKGQAGVLDKATFNTQLPFFVEMVKPAVATQDDTITLKGVFYNYLDETVEATVQLQVEGATILNRETQTITIPSNYLTQVSWSVYVSTPGRHNVTIYAQTEIDGEVFSDGLRKELVVQPNGVTELIQQSGLVDPAGTQVNLTQYEESISDTHYLVVSEGLMDVALDSWERLVGYPYGCLEQTLSRVIPDALILNYLNQTGELDGETKDLLEEMLFSGLTRLYGMQHYDGGFGWWKEDNTNVYMTAYALYGLTLIADSDIAVRTSVLSGAVNYLMQAQKGDGRWTTSEWVIDDLSFTAYVLRGLLRYETGDYGDSTTSTITQAISYFKQAWSTSTLQSSYAAALFLSSTFGTSYWDASFATTLLSYVISDFHSDLDGSYWSYDDTYYWRALGGNVETTATVMQALTLVNYGAYSSLVGSALQWLLAQQRYWGWGNTADTAAAITAVVSLLNYQSSSTGGAVAVEVDGSPVHTFDFSSGSGVTPLYLGSYLEEGTNTLTLDPSTNGTYVYYLYSKQVLRSPPTVTIPSEVNASRGEAFDLPVTITPSSDQLRVVDLTISLADDSWVVTGPTSHHIEVLDGTQTVVFSVLAPDAEEVRSINGIQVDYYFSSLDHSQVSPGRVWEVFGPVTVRTSSSYIPALVQKPMGGKISELTMPVTHQQEDPTLAISKTYSQMTGFAVGSFVTVTVTLKNTGDQTQQFLMVTDPTPTGFEVDTTSLEDFTAGTASLASGAVTFFLGDLSSGESITWSYRLIANSVIHSSVAGPAKVSPMYDTEVAYSNLFVLGDSPVVKDLSGKVFRDLELPSLTSFEHNVEDDRNPTIQFTATALDDDAVARVVVYYDGGDGWSMVELQQTEDGQWKGSSGVVTGKEVPTYVEVHDRRGNVYVSEIELVMIALAVTIPVLVIAALVITALGAGGVASKYTQSRLRKED